MTNMSTIYEKALEKHVEWKGKISTELKMPLENRDDLSVAYTPGVAEPCRQIHKNPDDVYKYTWKGNTIPSFRTEPLFLAWATSVLRAVFL